MFILSRIAIVFGTAMIVGCGQKAIVVPPPKPTNYVFQHPTAAYSLELPSKPDVKTIQAGGLDIVQYRCRIGMDAAFSTSAYELDGETDLSDIESCKADLQERLVNSIEPLQGKILDQKFRLLQDKYPLLEANVTIQIPNFGQAEMIHLVFLTEKRFVQLGIMGQPLDLQSSSARECLRSLKVLTQEIP